MSKFYFCIFLLISFAGKAQFYEEKYTTQELIERKEQTKKELGSKKNEALYLKALVDLAARYNKIQKFDSSLVLSTESLALAEKIGNNFFIASSKLNIGHAYESKELYFEASKYFEETIVASQLAKDDSLLALGYYLGGMCYSEQKEYQRALNLLKKGKNLSETKHLSNQLTRCLNIIGIIYSDTQKPDSALLYFEQCLKISEANNIERMTAISYKNVGKILLYTKTPTDGIKNIEKSVVLFLKSKNPKIRDLVIYSYFELAKYYHSSNQVEQANKYAKAGIKLNETLNYTDLQLAFNKILYTNYKALGEPSEALKYLEEYQESSNKINENFLKQQAAALGERFKSEQQKTRIKSLNQANERDKKERNWLIVSLLTVIIFLFFAFYLYQTIKQQKAVIEEINQNLEAKVEERTAELQAAYNEIKEAMLNGQTIERRRVAAELHDNLGSILSAIGMSMEAVDEANLGNNDKRVFAHIKTQIDVAYKEVRLLSHNLQPEELEKYGLRKALEKLQAKTNANQRLNLSLEVQDLSPLSKEIEFNLYTICLELINNTIKHSEATEAKITFLEGNEGKYQMQYTDNGKGFDATIEEGFGLKSIKNRVQQIGGTIAIFDKKGMNCLVSFKN